MRSSAAHLMDRQLASASYRTEHRRWVIYMLVSTASAVVTAFFGLVLAGASLLRFIDSGSFLALIGTLLLMTTFPLLVFSAHCLDRIEDANRANRMASYRQMVFGDSELEK